jgi:hypothetical protein
MPNKIQPEPSRCGNSNFRAEKTPTISDEGFFTNQTLIYMNQTKKLIEVRWAFRENGNGNVEYCEEYNHNK